MEMLKQLFFLYRNFRYDYPTRSSCDDNATTTNNNRFVSTRSDNVVEHLDADRQIKSEYDVETDERVKVLRDKVGGGILYLIGTNHASPESGQAVNKLLRNVKPHTVVIELCRVRAGLTGSKVFVGLRKFDMRFLLDAIDEMGLFGGMILYCMGYTEVIVSRALQVDYGSDMRAPILNPAKDGYKIILGDRNSDITMKRMALSLNVWTKICLTLVTVFAAVFGSRCFLLKIPPMLMTSDRFKDVLIRERDVYLTYSLQTAVRIKRDDGNDAKPTKVVGVVGEGHIPGILNLWGKVTEQDKARVMDTERL